jgi:hypothetical protein
MGVSPELYKRKPFEVEAVQVTEDNLEDVADWCDGEVRYTASRTPFVKVNVQRPLSTGQTRAFAGDWVLYAGRGFKVYTTRAFESNFEPVTDLGEELVLINPEPEVKVFSHTS